MNTQKPAMLPGASCFDLANQAGTRQYRLFVGGKPSTDDATPNQPLVILMDANWLFASIYEFVRVWSLFESSLNNPLVVGVGYPTDDALSILRQREEDMAPLPKNTATVQRNLEFVYQEIPRFLQNEYRFIPAKTILAGHSWGAAFALHVLTSNCCHFDAYLASSPPILYTWLEDIEAVLSNMQLSKKTELFVSVGSEEDVGFEDIKYGVPKLTQSVSKLNLPLLDYFATTIEGFNHATVTHAAITRGLQHLLR